ncbi:MAG: murein biosynthesis integral membrane protein MurJ [Rhodospirillaceae bacterium]|nr:murein biosynthesis integral membrane protein MurJ [Rhodospirillaceae bacterium]
MTLSRAIAVIGGWTMVSRLTGLAREMLIAAYLGAGAVADSFFVAFRFPNLFRSLFAEGAFNAAFVPLFSARLETGGEASARDFAEQCLAVLVWIVLALVAVIEIAMPWAMLVLAPGFGDVPGKMDLAVDLSRITFPYLLFISMVSLQSGVLNAMGRFAAAAATPVLLNLVSIAVLVLLAPYTPTPGHAMAWGVSIAGLAQFLWLVAACRNAGMGLRLVRPRLSPDVKLMLRRVVPGAIGAGGYQINLVINTMIASVVADGAVSYLNYAERVNQLPLGVVGVAIGTALLPMLSRQIGAGDEAGAIDSQNRAIEMGMLLTLPAAVALMVVALPLVSVLFQRGSFSVEDSRAVADTLRLLAAGLPAYVLIKALTPGFFARHDTRTPVRVAGLCMAANVALNLILMERMGYLGMALSTALSAWLNVVLLVIMLRRRGYLITDRRLKKRIARMVPACMIMAVILAALAWRLDPWFAQGGLRFLALAILVVAGIVSYGATALATQATSLAELKDVFRRSSGT